MAAIYSGTATGSGIIRYSFTDMATTSATSSTATLDLENYLFSPANTATFRSIQDTVNQYMTTRIAAGYYPGEISADYGVAGIAGYYTGGISADCGGRGTAGNWITDGGTGTAGNWITDTNFNPIDNSLNVRVNFATEEEIRKNKEEEKKREKEYQRYFKQQKIKSNLLIKMKPRGVAHKYIPENEQIAMETLREYITETEFRKYLRFGFICVEGVGGKTYQVFKNGSHTKVWKSGHIIEEICIHIKDRKVPPTDSVIAFRTMIQASEESFRKMGNVYNMRRAA